MARTLTGITQYFDKTRQFSYNARQVMLHSAFIGLAFGVFRFLFNFYVLSLGYDEAFIGTLQTASSFANILMALPAAYLAERFSPKKIMITSAILGASALAGLVLLPYAPALIIFQMVVGLSMSVRQVAVAPFLMSNTTPDERQWVFSFNIGLMTISSFFGNLLGGWLPSVLGRYFSVGATDTLAYQAAIGTMILVMLFSTLPILGVRVPRSRRVAKVNLPWVQLGEHGRQISRLLLPQLIIGLGAGMMMPFMNIYFRKVYGFADGPIAFMFALGGLSMAIAQFLGPPLADRMGKIQAVIFTQAISIPFLLTMGLGVLAVVNGVGSAILWFVVAGIAYIFRLALMNLSNPIYQTFLLEQVPVSAQALTISLSSLSFEFGWFVMPQISGWLQVEYGEQGFIPIFFTVAALYATAIAMEWAFFRRKSLQTI